MNELRFKQLYDIIRNAGLTCENLPIYANGEKVVDAQVAVGYNGFIIDLITEGYERRFCSF